MDFRSLTKAIKEHDKETVQALLYGGLKLNLTFHYPPLCLAVNEGDKEIVEILLHHGADALRTSDSGDSPVLLAAQGGNLEIMDMLVRAGGMVNLCNVQNAKCTPLYMAVMSKHPRMVEYLLNAGADPDSTGSYLYARNMPLHLAATYDSPEILNLLLAARATVNAINDDRSTPLHMAAFSGHSKNVERLIACGAVVDLLDSEGCSPLMCALRAGHIEPTRQLCVAGAKLNTANHAGQTPLNIAISHGHVAVLKTILRFGADVNRVADINYFRFPLHVAVRSCIHRNSSGRKKNNRNGLSINKEIEILDSLLQAGAELNAVDKDGYTPLHLGVKYSCDSVIEYIIKAGVQYATINESGNTPLVTACSEDSVTVIRLLVQYCPGLLNHPIHSCIQQTKSPLLVAARNGNQVVLQLLMEAGYRYTQEEIDVCLEDSKVAEGIARWIREVFYQPWTLTRVARTKVRDLLYYNLHSKVYRLPIPQKLKDSIIMHDVYC